MKMISPDFPDKNYQETGDEKDVAKLYLKFFSSASMFSKINELKKLYENNRFINVNKLALCFLALKFI